MTRPGGPPYSVLGPRRQPQQPLRMGPLTARRKGLANKAAARVSVKRRLKSLRHARRLQEYLISSIVRSLPRGSGLTALAVKLGRWNANGPGAARLFYELNAGDNFTDIAKALPGDFLKIWWTNQIGAKERRHLVVFQGTRRDESGERYLRFWSSNIPDGYGEKEIPMCNAKRLLFSRLSRPKGLQDASKLPADDKFLAAMLTDSFTMDQVKEMTWAK